MTPEENKGEDKNEGTLQEFLENPQKFFEKPEREIDKGKTYEDLIRELLEE